MYIILYTYYLTVKTLANYRHLPSFFANFYDIHSIFYGFTIACCQSILVRLLDLPLLTIQVTHTWRHMVSCLWHRQQRAQSNASSIIYVYGNNFPQQLQHSHSYTSFAILPLYHRIPLYNGLIITSRPVLTLL